MASKKEYVAVAKAINAQRSATHSKMVKTRLDALAEDLAAWFASDNPNFSHSRFLEAAGVAES